MTFLLLISYFFVKLQLLLSHLSSLYPKNIKKEISMKILTKLKILAVVLLMFSNTYGMLTEDSHTSSDSTPITQSITQQSSTISAITTEVRNVAPTSNATPSNRGRDYGPFLRSMGVTQNIEKVIESCRFLENNYITPEQIAQADMEALSLDRTPIRSVYDWRSAGWGIAQWFAGTSQNFASITVVICAVLANTFPNKAVALATSSGAVAGIGALLSKVHSYCKTKRLTCIAYNMVVMAGQAAARERAGLATLLEEGRAEDEDNDDSLPTSSSSSDLPLTK